MDAEPGGGDLRGVTRDSSMDLASHHWSIWTDLKSGRRRSGAEISAGSVEAAGRFRDVSYCSVDLPTLETARFSKSFSTVPHHHYPRRVLTYRAFSHAHRLITQSESESEISIGSAN